MADIKISNVEALGKPLGQYSHMTRVKAGEYLFIAGMLAPGESFDAQCGAVFAQIETALKSAGAGWGNVVQFTTYLVAEALLLPRAASSFFTVATSSPRRTGFT